MKYKVGDRVRIKSINWYNENKDENGNIELSTHIFISEMSQFCGKVMTIKDVFEDDYENVDYNIYYMEEIDYDWTDEMIESLVERNGKTYPYKIGDRVVLKGNNRCATITDLKYNSWGNLSYYIKIDNDKDISIDYPTDLLLPYDNMIEGLMEDTITTNEQLFELSNISLEKEMEWNLPKGYQFVDENGNVINAIKIALEKKNKYPKNYKECCTVLCFHYDHYLTYDDEKDINPTKEEEEFIDIMDAFSRLIVCRNAYWKIAGEQMGLRKPWKPDWTNQESPKYCIASVEGQVKTAERYIINTILAFPTPEMRDTFYKNFKELIESVKEFL